MKYLSLKDSVTPCPYLPEREFTAENFIAPALGPVEMDRLLQAGFRHFGSYYFRPVCRKCRKCVPLRVDVRHHHESKSERRITNRNSDLTVFTGAPAPSFRAFSLYQMHQHRFERQPSTTYEQFVRSFFSPTFGNTQLSIFYSDLLVSVLHLDVTGTSVSAVYCYFDTGFGKRSLGTYSILAGLRLAVEMGVPHYYLGYVVAGNRHMAYKTRFKPNEILVSGGWLPYTTSSGDLENRGKYAEGFPGADYKSRRPFAAILCEE